MYTRGQPEGAVKKYLDWILSDAGQITNTIGHSQPNLGDRTADR